VVTWPAAAVGPTGWTLRTALAVDGWVGTVGWVVISGELDFLKRMDDPGFLTKMSGV